MDQSINLLSLAEEELEKIMDREEYMKSTFQQSKRTLPMRRFESGTKHRIRSGWKESYVSNDAIYAEIDGFIRKRIGKKFDDVYSEFCRKFKADKGWRMYGWRTPREVFLRKFEGQFSSYIIDNEGLIQEAEPKFKVPHYKYCDVSYSLRSDLPTWVVKAFKRDLFYGWGWAKINDEFDTRKRDEIARALASYWPKSYPLPKPEYGWCCFGENDRKIQYIRDNFFVKNLYYPTRAELRTRAQHARVLAKEAAKQRVDDAMTILKLKKDARKKQLAE